MGSETFFSDLPPVDGFGRIADASAYKPLPVGWVVGLADVVRSTEAIQNGRYKAVNTAGAAVISAVSNALGTLDFPYVFTGDGMCYAVGPEDASVARRALGAAIAWVGSELGLTLRGGECPVESIRAAGRDVRVARFAPSPRAVYAMFSGGGLVWADSELKKGNLAPVPHESGVHPDLSGLSCRFSPVRPRHGLILSLIVSPRVDHHDMAFRALVDDILELVETSREAERPLPAEGVSLGWPPYGFADEAKLSRRPGQSLLWSRARVAARTLGFALIMKAGRRIGTFSPERYTRELVENSDYRKFEDRLMMTLDCSPDLAHAIEEKLLIAQAAGVADHGLHRQNSALITCVVPSPTRPDHVHFIDGGSGGYALAALALKRATDPVSTSALEADARP